MATSGSIDFSQTRQEFITSSLRLAGVLATGESASAADASDANTTLNLYLKALQAKAPQLWRQTQGVLFLTPGTYEHSLPGGRAARLADAAFTTLSVAAVATDTTITVTSATGIADGDNIGVELSDGTRQWTTVSGSPAGNVVTLSAALTGDAASELTVYAYTNALERPLRITQMIRRSDCVDIEVPIVSRQEFWNTPTKTQSGTVLLAYYDPQLTTGTLNLWPTGANVKEYLIFTFERNIEDVDSNPNNLDIPVEWLEAVRFGFSYRLAIEFGGTPQRLSILKSESKRCEEELLAFDQEYASIYFAPDLTRRRR